MFMGVSPLQYTHDEGSSDQQQSGSASSKSNTSSSSSDDGSGGGGAAAPAVVVNGGVEPVFGEFKAFELADADLRTQTRATTTGHYESSGSSRALRKRQRLQRQYVPEVLRSDVFRGESSTGGGLVTTTTAQLASTVDMMEENEDEDNESTFQRTSPSHYGATAGPM